MNYIFDKYHKREIILIAVSIFILFTFLFPIISASRLPIVGGDNSTWGEILNDYLMRLAGENATILNQTTVNSANINITSNIDMNSYNITDIDYIEGYEPSLPATPAYPDTKFLNGLKEWTSIIIGASSSTNVYFTNESSDIAGYKKLSYINEADEIIFEGTITSGEYLARTYLSDSPIDTDSIASGPWLANYNVKVSSKNGNTYMKFEAFMRNANNTETILFSYYSPDIENTDFETVRSEVIEPQFNINSTERFGVKVYINTTSQSAITISSKVGGLNPSYFQLPVTLRHRNLRALNEDSDYLHYSSTGNITTTGNISAGYFYGQPITGSIGSGIIWANGTNNYAEINITCSGLNCSWGAFKVRLVNTSNIEKYCDISAGSRILTNNQQSILYVDNNCIIQEVSVQTYVAMSLSPGGITDFANIITENGEVYNVNGLGIENKRIIKLRTLLLRTMHLNVLTGFNKEEGTFPQLNITAGSYVYLMDVVDTTKQNTTIDYIEIISHVNSTSWGSSEKTGLNYTYCDTETGTVLCTDTGKYRRIFMFLVGYNDSTDTTHLHQLLPSQTVTYTKLSDCLDTLKYPVTYTLPSFYKYGGVMLYAYCARPSDTAWASGWIDLRTVKQSTATGGVDTTNLLDDYLKSDNTLMVNISNTINALYAYGNINNYYQINVQNLNNGTNASSDIVATSNEGNETNGYIDMGINGGNYSDPNLSVVSKNDGYLLVKGMDGRVGTGNLSIGTASVATVLKFFVGGTLTSNIVGIWNSLGLLVYGNLNITGNISGNNFYGGMYTSSTVGLGGKTLNSTLQRINFSNSENRNGFLFVNSDTLELMNLQGAGEYQVTWHTEKTGTQNHIYWGYIFINEIQQNSTFDRSVGQASNAVRMQGTGFIRLNQYDNVTLRLADTSGTSTPAVYIKNVNLVRVGN